MPVLRAYNPRVMKVPRRVPTPFAAFRPVPPVPMALCLVPILPFVSGGTRFNPRHNFCNKARVYRV